MARSGRDRFILLGDSRGADYLPFIVNRLAPDLGQRLALIGMTGGAWAVNAAHAERPMLQHRRAARR